MVTYFFFNLVENNSFTVKKSVAKMASTVYELREMRVAETETVCEKFWLPRHMRSRKRDDVI